MNFDELMKKVEKVIEQIYTKEEDLIKHGLSEWTISAQFYYYIRKECQKALKGYSFDSEYNLMSKIRDKGYVQKCIFASEKSLHVRPDFIIHKRGDSGGNFLWVEMKRVGGEKWEKDLKRVRAVTQEPVTVDGIDYVTGYAYGLGILFYKKKVVCKWFMNGDETVERVMTGDLCGTLKWSDNNNADIRGCLLSGRRD